MEISGVIFRPVQSFSGDLFDTYSSKPSFSGRSINAGKWVSGHLGLDCSRKLKSLGFSSFGFCNNRRLQCYVSPICGGKKKEKKREKEKEKEKEEEKREIKKKMKLVKGLWKNLSMYSEMEFLDIDKEGSDGSEQGKIMSKASEILLVQLLRLRAEEKELKRKQKAEKAKLKAASIKMIKPINLDSEPSSSSSSNAECREVINMNSMGSSSAGVLELPITIEPKVVAIQEETTTDLIITNSSLSTTEEEQKKKITVEEDQILMSSSEKSCCRIDVCMGGKCKKMGSEALLEELKNRVGIEGAVVGCKCMGKCKNSPNVRVVSKNCRDKNVSQGKNNKPLYLGVGLEDVGAIVANFLEGEGGGGEQKGFGFC